MNTIEFIAEIQDITGNSDVELRWSAKEFSGPYRVEESLSLRTRFVISGEKYDVVLDRSRYQIHDFHSSAVEEELFFRPTLEAIREKNSKE